MANLKQLKPKLHLRTVLIVPFLLQIAGAVGLVGYLSFRNGQQAVNDLATQLRDELTARIRQQVQSYMETPFLVNGVNAIALSRGDIQVAEKRGYYLFWQQAKTYPTTNLIYCGTQADGAFLSVGRSNKDKSLEAQSSNPVTNYYLEYYDLDQKGFLTNLKSKLMTKPYDPRTRPWYIEAQKKAKSTWSEIYLDFDGLAPVITASTPAYDQTGELIGVCATDFFLAQELNEFLSKLEIGKSGETFIIERTGTLVSSSTYTEEKLLIGEGENTQRLLATESKNPLVKATARHLRQRFGNFSKINGLQQIDFQLPDQGRQFVQVSPFNDGRGIDWLIVVVVPEADFMDQIYKNNQTTIILCILALGVAAGIGILTARWITEPVFKLNQASQAIATGKLQQNVQVQGVSELEALAGSFNQMASQLQESFTALETVNNELEDRVKQRTLELQEANAEITHLNEQLQAENLRMGAELEVAQRLQQMILPKEVELQQIINLDIAGFMEPAAEVGGDYYDVIQDKGKVRISIGDVTGHGLHSGMVMLMAQTAVRTLLAANESDPVKFLNVLNEVIYTNTRRMDSYKNMTLALLEYEAGVLRLSGQHEELILVRQNGEIERIDTLELGFPLGLESDISSFIGQTEIHLQPGEVAVLYTDGIPEAVNAQNEFYGLERLYEVLQQNCDRPATEIRAAVIENIRQFIGDSRVLDDITLVVFKQKNPEV